MSNVSKPAKEKASWTPSKERYFIELLIEQEKLGKRVGTVWTKDAWRAVERSFNQHFNIHYDQIQLKNRLVLLKKKHGIVHELQKQSGFGWDCVTHAVTADDEVWDSYIMAHPDAAQFQRHAFPLYELLQTIFGGGTADGKGQISTINLETQEKIANSIGSTQYSTEGHAHLDASENIMESSDSTSEKGILAQNSQGSKLQATSPMTSSHNQLPHLSGKAKETDSLHVLATSATNHWMSNTSKLVKEKASWTPSKERYFIELLIEQEKLGKRVDTVWTKDAWRDVEKSFNQHFNSQFDQTQLKNRVGLLKKKYGIVHELQKESKFGWDHVTHAVTADDDVWDSYIMAHPAAAQFRRQNFPLYELLLTIFGGGRADGKGQLSTINLETQEKIENSFGSTQYPSEADVHLDASKNIRESNDSSSEKGISAENSRESKQQATSPLTSSHNKRVCLSGKAKEGKSLHVLATSAAKLIKLKEKKYSMGKGNNILGDCVIELQKMSSFSVDDKLQAIELLKDEKEAIIFMNLEEPLRSYWLQSKINKSN